MCGAVFSLRLKLNPVIPWIGLLMIHFAPIDRIRDAIAIWKSSACIRVLYAVIEMLASHAVDFNARHTVGPYIAYKPSWALL